MSLKERLLKLYALAQRGVGGEKENAEKILKQLLLENGMSIEDLERSENTKRERGDKWILYTMREGKELKKAYLFLKKLGITPDSVNDNLPELRKLFGNNPRKVFANVYIDDHNAGGLVFSGPVDNQSKNK